MPALTLLESHPLPGGYSELTLCSENPLSPLPGPGHYLGISLAPQGPPMHCPIMQAPAPDRLQVLAQSQLPISRGTVIDNAHIEGEALLPDPARRQIVLVSSDSALACSIFAASGLRKQNQFSITVFAHFDGVLPFKPAPSQILMPACPPGAIAAVPLLDSWNIPSRLSSTREQSGFYPGDISGLLEHWWRWLDEEERMRVQFLGFGDGRFLSGVRKWCEARRMPLQTAEVPN